MHAYSIGPSRPSNVRTSLPQQRRPRCLLFAGAIIGLLSIGQAAAQEAAEPAVAQAPVPTKPGKSGKVCERQDVTGSRMKKRVCYTPEQWQAREAAAKQMVRELDGRSISKDASGGFQDFNPSNGGG